MNPVYRKFFDIEDSVRESRLKTRERAIAYGLNTKIDTDGRIISDEDKNVSADIPQKDTEPQEAAPETPAQEVLPPVEGLRGKEKHKTRQNSISIITCGKQKRVVQRPDTSGTLMQSVH